MDTTSTSTSGNVVNQISSPSPLPPAHSESTPIPTENPIITQCNYYIPKKKRFCRMIRSAGKSFCHEHLEVIDGEKKLICPYNIQHVILESKYESHITRCKKKFEEGERKSPAYIVHDSNTGSDGEGNPDRTLTEFEVAQKKREKIHESLELSGDVKDFPKARVVTRKERYLNGEISALASLPIEETDRVAALVRKACSELSNDMDFSVEADKSFGDPAVEALPLKHEAQHSILVEELRRLCGDDAMFCELGCGKGKLSFELVAQTNGKSKHLLIDRDNFRFDTPQADSPGAKAVAEGRWHRVTSDIRHLKLSAVPLVQSSPKGTPICLMGKHLCGAATDLSLRCARNCVVGESQMPLPKICIALCCHHRCDWKTFPSTLPRSFPLFEYCRCSLSPDDERIDKSLLAKFGIFDKEFALVARMSSWAVCGGVPVSNRLLGSQCKRLLDYARVQYLNSLGYNAKVKRFVSTAVTPENALLVAEAKKD